MARPKQADATYDRIQLFLDIAPDGPNNQSRTLWITERWAKQQAHYVEWSAKSIERTGDVVRLTTRKDNVVEFSFAGVKTAHVEVFDVPAPDVRGDRRGSVLPAAVPPVDPDGIADEPEE